MNIECACAIEMARDGLLRVAMNEMIRSRGTVNLNIVGGFLWYDVDMVEAKTWCDIYSRAGGIANER